MIESQNRAIVIPIMWSSKEWWKRQGCVPLLHIGVFNEGTRTDFASFWLLRADDGSILSQISGRNGENQTILSQEDVDAVYPLIKRRILSYIQPLPSRMYSTLEKDARERQEYSIPK